MNNLDKQYQALLQDILDNGVEKKDRTGTGTISVFGRQIRHKMSEGFPLLTTKKMAWKTMVTELIWFLRGDTSIEYLLKNDCNIWTGDSYKNYCKYTSENSSKWNGWMRDNGDGTLSMFTQEEFINKIKTDDVFAERWGDLGKIYGYQWRNWNGEIDQISELIRQLNENPDSRRLLVSAWNPSDLPYQVLPPCHYGFQVYTRELSWEEQVQWVIKNTDVELENLYIVEEIAKSSTPKRAISLMFNMRSVDTFLGLPFNIASYGLLLLMIADEVNMVPDELIGTLGDVHLYSNHIEQAKEQISREPFKLPTVHVRDGIFSFMHGDVILENYKSHPTIKAPLSN